MLVFWWVLVLKLMKRGRKLFRTGGFLAIYTFWLNSNVLDEKSWSIYLTQCKFCRHFGLNWAFVDSSTPVHPGVKFCVCAKEFLPWVVMPLQIVYVNENRGTNMARTCFSFGSGTLQGHLLVRPSLICFFQANFRLFFSNLYYWVSLYLY